MSVDAAGNRYIADCDQNRVFRVDPAGVLTLFAGTGVWLGHPNGDGGPAVNAALNCPTSTAIDSAGNVYIAEQLFRVRKVDVSGVITTVAGTGDSGFSGDGGPATSAQLGYVNAVALDSAGNLYTAEGYPSHRVRRVDASTGVIVTIAGNGSNVFGGDGGLAIGASLSEPNGIAVDGAGNVYIADTEHSRVRKVAAGTGIISTVAGNGLRGFTGDGGSATSARLSVATVALQRLIAARRGDHEVACGLEDPGDEGAERGAILHDENSARSGTGCLYGRHLRVLAPQPHPCYCTSSIGACSRISRDEAPI